MSKDQQSLKQIRKRDGSVVSYDRSKIESAIEKALRATEIEDPDLPETLTQEVQKYLSNKAEEEDSWIPSVEEVQDLVERVLIENDLTETAKAYILYRRQHQEIRQVRDLMSDLSMVEGYLDEESWRVKENSNMSYSLQGLNIHITERVVSSYWLEKIYPPSIRDAHKEGDFHIHDLGTLGPYCVGWDLQDLLMNGFKGVRGKIESAPARHFRVALMHVVNFMYTLQGEAAGAQAFSHLDTYLAPFIRHDGLNYDQVKQAMQEFIFNMNVPTRTGFQTPFTNITLDLTIPNHLEDQNVIMGGEIRDGKYGDYQEEMETFNRAFAEVMLEGDSQDRPFTFPIPTYNITKDFEWGREVLDPIWKMTAKYGIPY
ncbi:MAG: anaerobic ribonucleoside-triphosphate reductase, partial [Candidatus Bipolaricaulota bacterium]